jgi:hypothetical protein
MYAARVNLEPKAPALRAEDPLPAALPRSGSWDSCTTNCEFADVVLQNLCAATLRLVGASRSASI